MSWSFVLVLLCGSSLFHGDGGKYHPLFGLAKEIEVTNEWQVIGENDTIPAGMHIRMDMTTGEKWVKQIDEDEEDDPEMYAAVVQEDGTLQLRDDEEETAIAPRKNDDEETKKYDYGMMHRTLSKLPDEEQERIGGLPELPQSTNGRTKLTSKERDFFEKRMAEIWEKRQAELKEAEESMVDLPEVLKDRIKRIKEYLEDPMTQLNEMRLEDDAPEGIVTHILSVLEDLEFQMNDVDMARDFHTLGGWQLLVSLVSEQVHVPANKTISRLSRNTEKKIRAIQAQAAWAIGTAVKNTGEFSPYATEDFKIAGDSSTRTTAIDLLIDVCCKDYKDPNSSEMRTLLGKTVYGIGSLLRGNPIAQAHVSHTDGPARLGRKLRQLTLGTFASTNAKLVQKLLSLSGDLVSDVRLHGEDSTQEVNDAIVLSFTSADWCDSASSLLVTDVFLPVPVQETLLQTVQVLAAHCDWNDKVEEHQKAVTSMHDNWEQNKDNFDSEHLEQLTSLTTQVKEAFEKKLAS